MQIQLAWLNWNYVTNMTFRCNFLLFAHLSYHDGSVEYAEKIHGGEFIQSQMVVICIWCVLFVTSKFDVIFMFPSQHFGEFF